MRVRALLLAAAVLALRVATSTQSGNGPIGAYVYAAGFASPVAIVQDPTDRYVQFVVEQGGRIRAVRAGAVLGDFLNLQSAIASGGEQGLLGLAFAPDYATSGRFYVNFTNPSGHTVVARFLRSGNPMVADPGSRFDLMWGTTGKRQIDQPYANHNGGNLMFGADGYLYIGLGDGGAGDDPGNRAQSPSEFLGKMLRIDVNVPLDNAFGYRVPADNPFVSGPPAGTLPEIWSFGLRNPWRYSFDSANGALVIGDVGQGSFEEIDYEPRGRGGRNYGWSLREGAHAHLDRPAAFLPLVDPIWDYDHSVGSSITGGRVYRGSELGSAYQGRYFFADFVRGRVWSLGLTLDSGGNATASDIVEHTAALGGAALGNISSFGVDAGGELFIVNYSGSILKVANPSLAPPAPTGLHVLKPAV